jgi:SAM-dependent methyltransferase
VDDLSRAAARPVNADDRILLDLAQLARDPNRGLSQFWSLASGRQYRRLYRLFRRVVPKGASVLDWSPGNGHFSYFLVRSGYRAVGYTFEAHRFESWLGDPEYRLIQASESDPVSLPFGSEAFDAVTSVGVLEHVRETGGDEASSLHEIARVLKPGGVLVGYHLPNRSSATEWALRRLSGSYHHPFRYTRAEIRSLVHGAGLELLEARRYGVLPRSSCHRLLGPLRYSVAAANLWDAVDATLGALVSPICQNWLFVARKPAKH